MRIEALSDAVEAATLRGHDIKPVSVTGVVHLYACQRCRRTMDVWMMPGNEQASGDILRHICPSPDDGQ